MPSGAHWYIKIKKKFRDGIYLNRLQELKTNKVSLDLPINHFLVVEFYGHNRASIFRNSDNQTISSLYSPCILNFEYKMQITHLSNGKESDELLCYTKIKKTKEFEDESIGVDFYPKREGKFNIDIEDIMIGEDKGKKNPHFKLELNSFILENQQISQFESILKRMVKIEPEIASTMSKDDIPFMKKENLRKPKEDDET
jgi:hypothetical protein